MANDDNEHTHSPIQQPAEKPPKPAPKQPAPPLPEGELEPYSPG
jgi:hypothetical protein